jgi:hypothetical protein
LLVDQRACLGLVEIDSTRRLLTTLKERKLLSSRSLFRLVLNFDKASRRARIDARRSARDRLPFI